MELILWRHAEAEDGEPDEKRRLTAKGHKQASKMAQWLDRNLPSSARILCSPTVRTVQTVEALGRRYKVMPELGPNSTHDVILAAANCLEAKEPVVIVGHQPTLGQIASLLLTGSAQDWTVRKANVWWIVRREREDAKEFYLKAVVSPELVLK